MLENLGVVAGVEQDVLAAVVHQRREAPIQGDGGTLAVRVVKDGHTVWGLSGAHAGQQQHDDEQNAERMVAMHSSSSKILD